MHISALPFALTDAPPEPVTAALPGVPSQRSDPLSLAWPEARAEDRPQLFRLGHLDGTESREGSVDEEHFDRNVRLNVRLGQERDHFAAG